MEQDLNEKIRTLEEKIDAIYVSTEKTRKYFLWSLITTIVFLVLPLIALVFVIPAFLANVTSSLGL